MAAILAASDLIRSDAVIAAYAAIGTEVDPLRIVGALANPIALPVVAAPKLALIFRQWQPNASLRTSAIGIPEPLPTAAQVQPDILLVPALAVDDAGYRLGYGGGYYDRTLAELRAKAACLAIAVVYDEQRVVSLPRDAFDEPVDWVLSPSGLTRSVTASDADNA